MTIRLEITGAPKVEADIEAAQKVGSTLQEWAKSPAATVTTVEVWVNGLIYQGADRIGYYDAQTDEATYTNEQPFRVVKGRDSIKGQVEEGAAQKKQEQPAQ